MNDTVSSKPSIASDPDVEVLLNQTYATPGGSPLCADLYLPKTAAGPLPVVVYIHGGGFRIGARRLAPDLKRFFARSGLAMASIDYRLSQQAVFPAAVEDVKTAVRWLRCNAGRFGLDATRIGLWGSSAGGQLASLCGTTGPGLYEGTDYAEYSSTVQAVVDGYGPTDYLQEDAHRDPEGKPSDDPESLQLPKGQHSDDPDSSESRFLGAPIRTIPERVAAANPATYVKPGLPAFLVMHGLSDTLVPYNQSEILFDALAKNEGHATLALIDGIGHGFFDRNDVDDAGPREMHVKRCRGNTVTGPVDEQHTIFGLVGELLMRNLSK